MKRIRLIELWANIRTNAVAFLSITMFVSLGVGLFLGIGWGASALKLAAHDALVKGNAADIELQFPYGVTTDDLKEIEQVAGVSSVESGFSTFVVMKDGNTSHTLKVESAGTHVNQPTLVEGSIPAEKGQIALLAFWANKRGIKVGDSITFRHDANADANDADGMRFLTADTFEVTALVQNPEYLTNNSVALGISNIASGAIDCVGYVSKDSFDAGAFSGGWSNVYLRCESLDGLNTFSQEYREQVTPILRALEDLGARRAPARFAQVQGEAQNKLKQAESTIDDAERQLSEGAKQIEEGEKLLQEGKDQLDSGEKQLLSTLGSSVAQQTNAQRQLDEAYQKLAQGQAQYDAGLMTYNTLNDALSQITSQMEGLRGDYDALVGALGNAEGLLGEFEGVLGPLQEAYDVYRADPERADWSHVMERYAAVYNLAGGLSETLVSLRELATSVASALGIPLDLAGLDIPGLPALPDPTTVGSAISSASTIVTSARTIMNRLRDASIAVGGTTILLADLPGGIQRLSDALAQTKATLDSSKQQLDAGWAQYNEGKRAYDAGVAQGQTTLNEKTRELEQGKTTLQEKTRELEQGKTTLSEKTQELEQGKEKLENAQQEFKKLEEYEWVVIPRQDSPGISVVHAVAVSMLDSVKWAMALLFILVGLFVCYSAISRLVHEQIVQIGTKKATGFREGEIAAQYLAFSGIAVVVGTLLSVLLATFVVQLIMNPTVARQFAIAPYPPFVDPLEALVMGCIEMVLILAATWLAIHGLMRRNAIDLLSGESTASAKERFYERTKLWKRMSLFSQTVVNNCVNDKRRVLGTLVGVIGCTSLIVVAVTLWGNVGLSLTRHYENVYGFKFKAYLNEENQEAADAVALALYHKGAYTAPVFERQLQVRKADGSRSLVTLTVPTNEAVFKNLYRVATTSGEAADLAAEGVWVSRAYGEHRGVGPGDEVTLTEATGKTHSFTVAGIFDYHLIRHEFVISPAAYAQAFGALPAPNTVLIDDNGMPLDEMRDTLAGVEGYESLVDDYEKASYGFREINSMLNIVVLIYLALSAAMAVMVLLNLNVMFVEEKKRELIVLMICGFSVGQAKAYIYRDSIVLTALGIVLGILLGAGMGNYTVAALEPEMGSFVKGFYPLAALVGGVGAAVFATAVLLWSLRRIARFDLTDINRF